MGIRNWETCNFGRIKKVAKRRNEETSSRLRVRNEEYQTEEEDDDDDESLKKKMKKVAKMEENGKREEQQSREFFSPGKKGEKSCKTGFVRRKDFFEQITDFTDYCSPSLPFTLSHSLNLTHSLPKERVGTQ